MALILLRARQPRSREGSTVEYRRHEPEGTLLHEVVRENLEPFLSRALSGEQPNADEVARVLAGAARRIRRLLEERAGDDEDALARDEPLLTLLAAASLRTRIATGPHRGERWRRLGDRVEPREVDAPDMDPEASARVPQHGGMSLHADVGVPARDRRRLERLCRYVARPPLANERLGERTDGTLALRLETRWRDGTTQEVDQAADGAIVNIVLELQIRMC